MKKLSKWLVALLSISVLSLFVASSAFASELYRGGPGNGGFQEDPDAIGQRGSFGSGTGIPLDYSINLDGVLEDLLHTSLADALSMDIIDLTARMDAGETFATIALELGYDYAAISEMIVAARADALAQAVVDGLITQEQADWLSSRGNLMPAVNDGEGFCDLSGECLEDGVRQNTMMDNRGYRGNK